MTDKKPQGGTRAGAGRPKTSDTNLNLRCWASDKTKWEAAAEKKGLTLTEWVNQTLNKNA